MEEKDFTFDKNEFLDAGPQYVEWGYPKGRPGMNAIAVASDINSIYVTTYEEAMRIARAHLLEDQIKPYIKLK